MQSTIRFDTDKQHIHAKMCIKSQTGKEVSFTAIVDTGAPFTELSDRSLARVGYSIANAPVNPKDLQETQKYSKIRLPLVQTLGQSLEDWIVYVSRFDESWGIDALIGLDFLRHFCITIDYHKGRIITKPLPL
ncbi:MAG: retroviral-like aspartic protease family protein [Candidatus Peribacteraceae bacterium]